MTRALLLTIPLLLAANLAQAKPESCDWAFEIFKDKVSDSCQKDLLDKMDNEQDKIYTQRIFKNWQPLKNYDIQLDRGLIIISNTKDKEQDYLEVEWISMKPAMAIINGVVVVDEAQDPSMYRRIERMLKKADETQIAMGERPRINPFEMFLMSNEAYAAINRSSAEDAMFVFTMDGRTGTAEELVDKAKLHGTDEEGYVEEDTSVTGWFMNFFKDAKKVKCIDTVGHPGKKTIEDLEEKVSGNTVHIHPVVGSRTKYFVDGYPNSSSHILIDMDKGVNAAAPYTTSGKLLSKYYTGKDGHRHRRKHRGGRTTYLDPCSGAYNKEMNESCGSLWSELAADPDFPEVKAKMASFPANHKILYGKDLRCDGIYDEKTAAGSIKAHLCRQKLGAPFQKEFRRFAEGQSDPALCYTDDEKSCNHKFEDSELGGGAQLEANKTRKYRIAAMKRYAQLWIDEQDLSPDDAKSVCPALGLSEEEQMNTAKALADCKKPLSGLSQEVKTAFNNLKKNDTNLFKESLGAGFRQVLERRVLGAMVLSDCCNSSKCGDTLQSKHWIKLDGAKTTQ